MKKQLLIVCGLAINNNKILLLQRKDDKKDIHMKWELPGGKVEFGEKPRDAVKREFFEETGLNVEVLDLVPIIQSYVWGDDTQTFIIAYIVKITSGEINKSDHHTQDIKWINYEDINWDETIVGSKELIDKGMKHYE